MIFYYCNGMGDEGYFSEKDIIKAIYTAWNIEADLYILTNGSKKLFKHKPFNEQTKIVFAPYEDNEVNNEWLKEYGYYMEDGKELREIKRLDTGEVVRYDWSEVKQLV